MDDSQIAYDERGLVPCVVQDWSSGEVLTLAYMNAEALARTRETGEMHFFSRSRQELWHKGETSGNTQALRAHPLRLRRRRAARARRAGRAGLPHRRAHLLLPRRAGARRAVRGAAPRSSACSSERARERPDGSYTAELLGDPPRIGEKVREEADEVARAAARASPTIASPRRPPTCSTTSPCCCAAAASRWTTRSGCSMAVAAEAPAVSPSLDEVRALAREHNLIPLRHSFIDDCETPVSAFLKLREDGPAFLLESADQGQRVGPLLVHRVSPAGGHPLVARRRRRPLRDRRRRGRAATGQAPLRGPAAVRRRRGRRVRL